MDEVTEVKKVVSSQVVPQEVVKETTTVNPKEGYQKKKVIFRAYQVIWYILGVIEVLLGFRVVLKLLGANEASGFVALIYSASSPLVLPFMGIFRSPVSGGSVIEWSSLIAAIVYAVVAYGLVYLLQLIKPVSPNEVENKVDNT